MLVVPNADFSAAHIVVLAAAMYDLYGAHKRGKPPGCPPVHALRDAVQQAGTVSITASGRVHYSFRFNAWNIYAFTAGID